MGQFLLVPAYPGSPGSTAIKRLCVCVCTAYNIDLSSQLKASRQQAEVSRQELTEYKEKAARILQVECCTVQIYFLSIKQVWKCNKLLLYKR